MDENDNENDLEVLLSEPILFDQKEMSELIRDLSIKNRGNY